jgi:hypothetical protein
MQKEVWKDVPGYEGLYQVSDLGRVKSLSRIIFRRNYFIKSKDIIMKGTKKKYHLVTLIKGSEKISRTIHQLVAMAFLNHKPCGHNAVIDHINNNKLDNRLENLQIITQRDNVNKDLIHRSSKHTGVSYHKRDNIWQSRIFFNKKSIHLGNFKTELEASEAYQNKLKEINSNQ